MLLAILAVAVLLLLPGGLMLLAPWSVRPFLSAAFWIASWWWLSRLGPGRTAFLEGTLVAFAILGLTRLLKPIELRRPSFAACLLCGVMALLALGAATASWRVPTDAAFDALTARLLADRDGIPASYVPLLPILSFGVRPTGFAGLVADAGLLSGTGFPEALLALAGAIHALLALALFHALRRVVADPAAAAAAGALALVTAVLAVLSCGAELAIALALVAAPHVASRHRAPAVAAGVLLGASVLCGGIALPLLVLGIAVVRAWGSRGRILLAAGIAGLVVLPSLRRVSPVTFRHLPGWSRVRSVERLPDADDRAAMAWLEANTGPLAIVCADGAPAAAWIPGVAGRATVLQGRAGPVASGMEAAEPARPCSVLYRSGTAPGAGPMLFRSGAVTIVEMSKSLR